MTSKFGFFEQGNCDDFKRFESYANSNVYQIQNTEHYSRIIVWSTDAIGTLKNLVRAMQEPYFILYILNVSRTDQDIARYQSHELPLLDVERRLAGKRKISVVSGERAEQVINVG
ncbi:hypothetical protein [Paenibacillus sp. P36]|uniref:hypothetical protein n=1 Tax=Paenibacillus sp. P36 TaxID=3342538 RepID=UPI0038B33DAA